MPDHKTDVCAAAPPPGKPPSAQPSGEEDPGATLDDPVLRDAMREEALRSGTAGPAGSTGSETSEHQKPPSKPGD